MMGGTLFSASGKLVHRAEKSRGFIMGRTLNFMMGGTLFSPEGSWFKGLRKAGEYYGEGQFHNGRHPVLTSPLNQLHSKGL